MAAMIGYRNMQRKICRLVLAAAMTALSGGAALAQEYSSWSAHGSVTLKAGSERQIGELDLFVPLFQDGNSMLYLDLRAQSDESDNQEGNAGFGYRWMGRDVILGAYGFYDWRKSDETGNEFTQGMIGFELMTDGFDLRLNGYLPEDEEKLAAGATEVSLVGSTLQMRTGYERALPGGDAEIGFRLWGSQGGGAELRAFAGGFYFDAPDYRTVAGPRGRVEMRLFDIGFLGKGSRFTLGAEVTNDTVRDTQGYAIARLTIPFGGGRRSGWGGLDRRMADYVVRDVDVVTGGAATGTSEPVAYVNTGVAVGDVSLMTGGGNIDGAFGGGVGDLYVLDGSGGDFETTESIVLVAGQVLLGGASSIDLVGLDSGTLATFTAPGARPTVNGEVDGAAVVTLADDTMVIGLDIENISFVDNSYGIYGETVSGTYVTGNGIATGGNNGIGLFLVFSSFNTVSGNSITTSGAGGYGLVLVGSSDNTISENSIETSAISLWLINGSDNNTVTGNSIVTSGSGFGLWINSSDGNTVTGNSIATTGDQVIGLIVWRSTLNTVSGNTITTAGLDADGIYVWTSSLNTISDNTIVTEGDNSEGMFVAGFSDFNTISGNSITTNGANAYGLFLDFSWSNTVDGNIITTSGSQASGIYLRDTGSNTFDNNVIATGQADAPGFYFFEDFDVVENNTGTGNSYTGPADDCFVDASVTGPNSIDLCP